MSKQAFLFTFLLIFLLSACAQEEPAGRADRRITEVEIEELEAPGFAPRIRTGVDHGLRQAPRLVRLEPARVPGAKAQPFGGREQGPREQWPGRQPGGQGLWRSVKRRGGKSCVLHP